MRVLLDELTGQASGNVLDTAALAAAYAVPRSPWLRANMVASLDGAATGADGRTGSINNAPDKRVYDLLRSSADAIVVGAGTARIEGYGQAEAPVVVVSRRGVVPERLRSAAPGSVLLATCERAPGLAESRTVLSGEHMLVVGEDEVDLARLRSLLVERGLRRLLSEGGPRLLRALLAAGVVDELCATVVPRLVAGDSPRITVGPAFDLAVRLGLLLEEDGTLLGRWLL